MAEVLTGYVAEGVEAMRHARPMTVAALDQRVWRDLTFLAAKSLAVGLAVSLLLGLAVYAAA